MSVMIRICLLIFIFSQQAQGLEQPLDQNHFGHITFDPNKPLIQRWTTCYPDCSSKNKSSSELNNESKIFLKILDSNGIPHNDYEMKSRKVGDKFEITYTRSDYEDGVSEVVFQNNPKNGFVELMIQSEKDIQIEIDLDKLLIEEGIYGMGGIYNGTWLVSVDDYDSKNLSNVNQSVIQEGSWVGARTRFWTFLISPKNHEATANRIKESELGLKLTSSAEDGLHHFVLYFGPLNTKQFVGSEPELRQLMYAALWDWLRQLCFFIEWIFFWLFNFSGNAGLSILLLACVLKVIIYPLNRVAEKWQDDVNIIHSMLQPQIDEIKNNYSGEEANDRIMKLYKDKNINPFYSIKSLFGFLIQIPLFIAVFDVLGESIYLLGESFVFINDLSKPDQWATLPIFIPFFGSSLNLLPLCMMIISLLSAYLYSDRNLNKNLLDNQKRKLYLMSVLFFVLLFTFPSGMVLYWTTSNFLQLMQTQIKKALQ